MSTDHYNIDGPRSSSRVLRPPGGSYTDILGVKGGQNDAVKAVKSTPKSGIADCFKFEDSSPPTQPETKKEEETKENEKIQTCENGNENNNPKDNESSTNEKNQSNAPQKVRVPPGGWSSGLW
ncbi:uncharacterized protein LOC108741258 [Agrilus planipennis]|uniref:Uncharacterized protein LOC108741258 n=1 Tax=Agrilus planipennis TaxID=224129 RepID=A0A1W4XFD4_AGRPL|nr:uncharacterized protein LOC108741258 [Agrilus planipennis]